MKYHVTGKKACENLIHNIKKINEAMEFEEITENGITDRWMELSKLKQSCFRELGEWYYIEETLK